MMRQKLSKPQATHKNTPAIAYSTPQPPLTFQDSQVPPPPNFQGISQELAAPIQAKLSVSEPQDKYEKEADRVAEQVVKQIQAPRISQSSNLLQGKEPEERRSPQISSFKNPIVQRKNNGDHSSPTSSFEHSLSQVKSQGTKLPNSLQPKLENTFGKKLDNIRIHNNPNADHLSRSIQAKAFTTGQNIFFKKGAYQPNTSQGQKLLAHEITHTFQQNNNPGLPIQRAYEPAAITDDSIMVKGVTLKSSTTTRMKEYSETISESSERVPSKPGNEKGAPIPAGERLFIDDTKRYAPTIGKNWVKAMREDPETWIPGTPVNRDHIGYIKEGRVEKITYPENVEIEGVTKPRKWNDQVGEFIHIATLSSPNCRLVKIRGEYKRLSDDYQTILGDATRAQVNSALGFYSRKADEREATAKQRVLTILRNAATEAGLDNPAILANNENVRDQGLLKPLRLAALDPFRNPVSSHDDWENWVESWEAWVEGVYERIEAGATHLAESLVHWQEFIYPESEENTGECTIQKVEIDGSDLHDYGLGAVFVTFSKPEGEGSLLFRDKGTFKVVIKPEERSIEKSLLGHQEDSLANIINETVGLDVDKRIETIKMETHEEYGTLIEFVEGTLAKNLSDSTTQGKTDALVEGMAFVFITGLYDIHGENVIWKDGKPYFIDADNALKQDMLMHPESQSGFTSFSQEGTSEITQSFNENLYDTGSEIIDALLENSEPLVEAIREAYDGQVGRIVPLSTQSWASVFKGSELKNGSTMNLPSGVFYMLLDEGRSTDLLPDTDTDINSLRTTTKWGLAKYYASKLLEGGMRHSSEGGLRGEAGEANPTYWNVREEVAQIKADFDQGKIPFYNYDYSTGRVLHNGRRIWDGQNLEQAMRILYFHFPKKKETKL